MSSLTADQIFEQIVKPLPASEKLRLIENIRQDLNEAASAEAVGNDFWRRSTLDEIAAAQGVTQPCSFDAFLGGWPEEDKDDKFEETVARWRKEEARSTLS